MMKNRVITCCLLVLWIFSLNQLVAGSGLLRSPNSSGTLPARVEQIMRYRLALDAFGTGHVFVGRAEF